MKSSRIQQHEAAGIGSSTPPIYFFVPSDSWPDDMTPESGFFWSAKRGGRWNWTVQTYENLLEAGFSCSLVDKIPSEGIIVAHNRLFDESLAPNPRQLFVCIEADRGRHAFAQLHVQQNPAGAQRANAKQRTQLERRTIDFAIPNHFICYWPQPDLIPRDPARGDRFERIVYMGRVKNLAPELRGDEWSRLLQEHGLTWVIEEDLMAWKDYRRVDATLAVRDFAAKPHLDKPASKLHNAWRAGVPAVLGSETAFRANRRSDLDYLEVHSKIEALAALLRLRDDIAFRRASVANGRRRAQEVTPEKITRAWEDYLRDVAIPAYATWVSGSDLARRSFILNRQLWRKLEFSRKQIRRQLQHLFA